MDEQRRKKPGSPARTARRIVQTAVFVLFLLVIIFADPLATRDLMPDLFPRLSPLGGIATTIAFSPQATAWADVLGKYWPALLVLIAALIMGRFFCAWVCPLGATIDATDWLLRHRRKQRAGPADGQTAEVRGQKSEVSVGPSALSGGQSKIQSACGGPKSKIESRRWKYYLLAFLLLGALFGVQMTGWFDPLSLAPRTYAIVLHPYVTQPLGQLFGFLHNVPGVGAAADKAHAGAKTALYFVQQPSFRNHLVFLAIFLGIAAFGLWHRRYWCRNLCPLGGLFALISNGGVFKRYVEAACIQCRRCARECRMGCIDDTGKGTLAGECLLCMDCQAVCPVDAVRFTTAQPAEQCLPVDLSKRGFLTTCASTVAAVPVMKLNFASRSEKGNLSVVRPPGAHKESEFLLKCVRCGECMRVCKTNGLQPCALETGLEGLWTPRLMPRIGHCDFQCNLCGRVCPSQAIRRLPLEDKQQTVIGKARFNHNRCIPWVGFAQLSALEKEWKDVNCAVCEEVCPVPTKAIRFNTYALPDEPGQPTKREIRRPYVREDLCIGCGYCEKVCPVLGQSAVIVEGCKGKVEFPKVSKIAELFPAEIGPWKRKSEPKVHFGAKGLFEYINGGAEPYLTYTFKLAAWADYANSQQPSAICRLDFWEFEKTDDAFGVWTKDAAGEEQKGLGDRARLFENYLWMWRDRYFIRVEPKEGDVKPADALAIAQAALAKISAPPAQPPAILATLPPDGLVPSSIKFFHQKLVMDNIYLADRPIEQNVFGLSEKTDAVVADYEFKPHPPFPLLLIQYPTAPAAQTAFAAFAKLRTEVWKEEASESNGIKLFKDESGKFHALSVRGDLLAAVFRAQTREAAAASVARVSGREAGGATK